MRRAFAAAAAAAAALCAGHAAADGDAAYGEYLSGECVTCHRLDGEMEGIPAIVGWDQELFVDVMKDYQSGVRENEAMRSVAALLGEDELKALAAYFGGLEPKH